MARRSKATNQTIHMTAGAAFDDDVLHEQEEYHDDDSCYATSSSGSSSSDDEQQEDDSGYFRNAVSGLCVDMKNGCVITSCNHAGDAASGRARVAFPSDEEFWDHDQGSENAMQSQLSHSLPVADNLCMDTGNGTVQMCLLPGRTLKENLEENPRKQLEDAIRTAATRVAAGVWAALGLPAVGAEQQQEQASDAVAPDRAHTELEAAFSPLLRSTVEHATRRPLPQGSVCGELTARGTPCRNKVTKLDRTGCRYHGAAAILRNRHAWPLLVEHYAQACTARIVSTLTTAYCRPGGPYSMHLCEDPFTPIADE